MTTKIFRQIVSIIFFSMIFFIAMVSHAEIIVYNGVGEYFMTDETVTFAKEQAEQVAQRDILEQVSVYVEHQAKMIDHELDSDEIITISTGIIHVTDTKFSMTDENDGILVKSFVTAYIDTDELENSLEQATISKEK